MSDKVAKRLERFDIVVAEQQAFLHRVPDPDTRERAEERLFKVVEMRDQVMERLHKQLSVCLYLGMHQ